MASEERPIHGGRRFPRGARPSSRAKLLSIPPFHPRRYGATQAAWIAPRMTMWGNGQYGDCVTAEEAFSKGAYPPHVYIPDQVVIDWAEKHGVLNGATLTEVLDSMQSDGFVIAGQRYNDGPYEGVNYAVETTLQSALTEGPVKIAIDADALPSGAGNVQGWYALKGGRHPNTDHSVTLAGFGPASWLYEQIGVPLPVALAPGLAGYLLYTWSTIGFVSHDWIMGTCAEAYIRRPTTVGVPPLPGPNPPPPPPPPGPEPGPGDLVFAADVPAGSYLVTLADGHLIVGKDLPPGQYTLTPVRPGK